MDIRETASAPAYEADYAKIFYLDTGKLQVRHKQGATETEFTLGNITDAQATDLTDGGATTLHTHADVPTSRTITTTAPLTIDGGASADLSANRTLAISAATTAAAGSMSAADKTKLDGVAAGATVGAMVLIEDKNLSDADGTFDFQSIPATYRHLKIIWSARSDRAGTDYDEFKVKINNNAGNNYVGISQYLTAPGTVGQNKQVSAGAPCTNGYTTAGNSTANHPAGGEFTFFDYTNANFFKTFQYRGYQLNVIAGSMYLFDGGGTWLSASVINRITIVPGSGTNYKRYSRATLYGIL
jgi:hypothetical protein